MPPSSSVLVVGDASTTRFAAPRSWPPSEPPARSCRGRDAH